MRSLFSKSALLAVLFLAAMENPAAAFFNSRNWLAIPTDNNWNNDSNWSGGNAPDNAGEGAVFGTSTILNPTFTASTEFGGGFFNGPAIVFDPGASRYVIEINGQIVQMTAGIINHSSVTQTISNGGANGLLVIAGGSIVGEVTIINSGNNTETRFINGAQGGIVRLINANPTAAFHFYIGGGGGSITVGSIEGNGLITLDGTPVSVGSNNLNTTFSGVLSDGGQHGGSFTKVGTGSLVLSGINTYTGKTIVSSGALYINGSIASAQTTVNHGGLLGGIGVLGGNLSNHGIVSPGMSPGRLTVKGYYTQDKDGALRIEVAGSQPGQFDRLTVQGSAALDGTLQIVKVGNPKLKVGDRLPILTATGGVEGTFRNIESSFITNTILTLEPVYESNAVLLETRRGSFEQYAQEYHLSPNQTAVARGLDGAAGNRHATKLFEFLDYRTLSDLPGDFDKIAPEELTSIFSIATALANVQSLNIQRRTDDIRSGANGFSAAGLALNGFGPSYSGQFGAAGPSGSLGRDDGKDVKETTSTAPSPESRWGAFLSGTGEWVSVGSTDNARGYDLTSGGFTLGLDYKVTANLAVGLMAGYTGTTADLVDRGRVWVNGGKIGLYGTFFQNKEVGATPAMSKDAKEVQPSAASVAKGFYADVAVFGGYNSFDSRRSSLRGEARGDTDGGELNVLFATGYDFKFGALTVGPTASFNYTYVGTKGFTEHGSLAPLDVHGGEAESLRTAFGVKASCDWKVGNVLIKPEIRAAWQHEYGDAAYELSSNFTDVSASSFTVNGPQIGRDSVLLGTGLAIQLGDRCATYFYYDGELGRKTYQSTNVTGGIRLAF